MSLLRDFAFGAIGYGVSELTRDDEKAVNKLLDQPIDCVIDEWARRHGIYNRSNDLSRDLERLAEYYKDPYSY